MYKTPNKTLSCLVLSTNKGGWGGGGSCIGFVRVKSGKVVS